MHLPKRLSKNRVQKVLDALDRYEAKRHRAGLRKGVKRLRKCEVCGQRRPDVRRRLCPYNLEIGNTLKAVTTCSDCNSEAEQAI